MSDTLCKPPTASATTVTAWEVRGRRVNEDGSVSELVGTSFGRTEARAREHWVKRWGVGADWHVTELVFTREGGAL